MLIKFLNKINHRSAYSSNRCGLNWWVSEWTRVCLISFPVSEHFLFCRVSFYSLPFPLNKKNNSHILVSSRCFIKMLNNMVSFKNISSMCLYKTWWSQVPYKEATSYLAVWPLWLFLILHQKKRAAVDTGRKAAVLALVVQEGQDWVLRPTGHSLRL
jgi:hypothetical protein